MATVSAPHSASKKKKKKKSKTTASDSFSLLNSFLSAGTPGAGQWTVEDKRKLFSEERAGVFLDDLPVADKALTKSTPLPSVMGKVLTKLTAIASPVVANKALTKSTPSPTMMGKAMTESTASPSVTNRALTESTAFTLARSPSKKGKDGAGGVVEPGCPVVKVEMQVPDSPNSSPHSSAFRESAASSEKLEAHWSGSKTVLDCSSNAGSPKVKKRRSVDLEREERNRDLDIEKNKIFQVQNDSDTPLDELKTDFRETVPQNDFRDHARSSKSSNKKRESRKALNSHLHIDFKERRSSSKSPNKSSLQGESHLYSNRHSGEHSTLPKSPKKKKKSKDTQLEEELIPQSITARRKKEKKRKERQAESLVDVVGMDSDTDDSATPSPVLSGARNSSVAGKARMKSDPSCSFPYIDNSFTLARSPSKKGKDGAGGVVDPGCPVVKVEMEVPDSPNSSPNSSPVRESAAASEKLEVHCSQSKTVLDCSSNAESPKVKKRQSVDLHRKESNNGYSDEHGTLTKSPKKKVLQDESNSSANESNSRADRYSDEHGTLPKSPKKKVSQDNSNSYTNRYSDEHSTLPKSLKKKVLQDESISNANRYSDEHSTLPKGPKKKKKRKNKEPEEEAMAQSSCSGKKKKKKRKQREKSVPRLIGRDSDVDESATTSQASPDVHSSPRKGVDVQTASQTESDESVAEDTSQRLVLKRLHGVGWKTTTNKKTKQNSRRGRKRKSGEESLVPIRSSDAHDISPLALGKKTRKRSQSGDAKLADQRSVSNDLTEADEGSKCVSEKVAKIGKRTNILPEGCENPGDSSNYDTSSLSSDHEREPSSGRKPKPGVKKRRLDNSQARDSLNDPSSEDDREEGVTELSGSVNSSQKLAKSCYLCEADVPDRSAYTEHLLEKHHVPTFHCPLCNRTCSSAEKVELHLTLSCKKDKKAGGIPAPIYCSLCPSVFSRDFTLKRHMSREHNPDGPQTFSCSQCSRQFASAQAVKRHADKCRQGLAKAPTDICDLECEECSKRFASGPSLAYHRRTYHRNHHFTCICGKVFLQSTYYYKHRQVCANYYLSF